MQSIQVSHLNIGTALNNWGLKNSFSGDLICQGGRYCWQKGQFKLHFLLLTSCPQRFTTLCAFIQMPGNYEVFSYKELHQWDHPPGVREYDVACSSWAASWHGQILIYASQRCFTSPRTQTTLSVQHLNTLFTWHCRPAIPLPSLQMEAIHFPHLHFSSSCRCPSRCSPPVWKILI